MNRAATNPNATLTTKLAIGLAALIGLSACSTSSNYAPVVYHHKQSPQNQPIVVAGDASLRSEIPKTLSADRHPTARQPIQSGRGRKSSVQREPLQLASDTKPTQLYGQSGYADPVSMQNTYQSAYKSGPIAPVALREVEYREPTPRGGSYQVTVEPGDTVFGLSRTHGVSHHEIIAANGLKSPFALSAGQTLIIPKETTYTVVQGDTLFSISRAYNVDVKTLAQSNNIQAPYTLSTGQVLHLPVSRSSGSQLAQNAGTQTGVGGPFLRPGAQPKPTPRQASKPQKPSQKAPSAPTGFSWPAKGQILAEYGPTAKGQRNDGINIRLPDGAAIRAARGGEVIYVGSEISNFGNLVLIRHENGYVTAYAHARRVYVQRGDVVEKGQHIADVGRTGSVDEPQLHFEIRKDQKPVNPRRFLPAI